MKKRASRRTADGSRKLRRRSMLSTSAESARPSRSLKWRWYSCKTALCLQNRSSAFPQAAKLGSIPRHSGSSYCVGSHFHFICQHVCAGVAVSPTFLATTGPHVPRQELQGGWSPRTRLGLSGSSGWQEARKSSPTDCHCSGESGWPLTQPWFPHCVVMACQEEERVALELPCRKHAPEKNELSPNS